MASARPRPPGWEQDQQAQQDQWVYQSTSSLVPPQRLADHTAWELVGVGGTPGQALYVWRCRV